MTCWYVEAALDPDADVKELIWVSRKELDQITGEFFTSMTIPSSDGKEVLYRNQMPDYPKTK